MMSFSPSFMLSCWYSLSYTRPVVSLTARFVIFFTTLFCSMLSAVLSRCIQLKHSIFSLIYFCTFSFYHHVSLASHFPPLVTLSSSETTFLMQVTIFIYMLFTSPPSHQGPSSRTLSLKVCADSSLSFHHFILSTLMHLLRRMQT
jgi:hypothetical protein